MTRKSTLALLLLITLSACLPQGGDVPPSDQTQGKPAPVSTAAPRDWWQEAVFYEIFVRSFYDTDNDGIGDFNGITARLDYLQELGITAIWLMPIHPSPSYHGYDVIDYKAVNPEYGTMEDFTRLLTGAHQRDIRIIIDLVINHTSSQHPFFVDANSDPNSPYRDWYVWSESDPGNGWHQGKNGYYYGFFWDGMPDLNYFNPEVTGYMEEIVTYWLDDVGGDGFRVDAAKHLIEQDGKNENTPATHDWFANFYKGYKATHPQAYTVGEVFGAGGFIAKTYTGQFDHVFNFELASGFVNSANGGSNTGINSAFTFTLKDMPDGDYATFLTNHDQNRAMSMFNSNVDKAKVAAALLLTSPGTPFIYYGEEIGMTGIKPDEDIRLPMQWSGEENAGFSESKPWRGPDAGYTQVNVAVQANDPESLLSHYRNLIAIRKAHAALRGGDIALLSTGNSGVYATLRHNGEETLLVLINLTGNTIRDYELGLNEPLLSNGKYNLETLFGTGQAAPLRVKSSLFTGYVPVTELPPYSTLILKIHE